MGVAKMVMVAVLRVEAVADAGSEAAVVAVASLHRGVKFVATLATR